MISLPARLFRQFLRTQQPVLRLMRHPSHVALVEPALTALTPLPPGCSLKTERIAGRRVLVVHNQQMVGGDDRSLVYLHGGGYNVGSPWTHRAFAARLMQAGGFARVYIPSYRLAPKHPYPAGLEDMHGVWRALQERHPVSGLLLAGESAGAGLSLALCQVLRNHGEPLPERVFLHSPWLDVGLSGRSYHDDGHYDAFLGRHPGRRTWLDRVFARHYRGGGDPTDPLMSPMHADPSGLPPVYAQVGSEEIFLDDSRTLEYRFRTHGVPCHLEVWQGMWHAWGMLAPLIPEANEALTRGGRWLAHGVVSPGR